MRKTILVALTLLLAAFPASAVQTSAPEPDKNIEMLRADLHTLARIADVADDMERSRQVLLAVVDSDIDALHMPRGDGTYQWASLQREEGGRVKDEKTVEQVSTEKELRNVTVSGPNGYRVEVIVPRKKGTFSANNRVFVRNVLVDSTGYDGKVSHHEIPLNVWVDPGDATGGPLPEIGKSVKATVELGVESGSKAAVAEVALVLAKLVDDPKSPYFPAVTKLQQIRAIVVAKEVNRGMLKNTVDEAVLSLPGELEKRTAELEAMAEERKRLAEGGQLKGAIELGDATPDVTADLDAISRLLNGTVAEQAEGRTRLETLLAKLKPPPLP